MINSSTNLPLVQAIFENTKDYGFTNTLPVKSIIMAVREGLPQVFHYLNERIIKSDHIKKVLNTETIKKWEQECPQWGGKYSLMEVENFTNSDLTQKTLFVKDEEEDSDSETRKSSN